MRLNNTFKYKKNLATISLMSGALLFMIFLASGMLSLMLLTVSAPISFHLTSLLSVFEAGFWGTGITAIFLTALIIGAIVGIAYGGAPRHIGSKILLTLAGITLFFIFSLKFYAQLYNHNTSIYPWNWYYLIFISPYHSVKMHLLIITGVTFAMFAGFFAFVILKKSPGRLADSRFANKREVAKAGLFAKSGVVIAKAYNRILRVTGFEPVLVVAPMGSGKTAAVAIPNLLDWLGSMVINDLKGELFAKTYQYRKNVMQSACYCWAPADETGNSHGNNPFFYVSSNKDLWYRDIQIIAQTLIPSSNETQKFWPLASQELFLLISLYLFETQGTATLAEVYKIGKQENFIGWLAEVIEEGRGIYPDTIIGNAAELLNADSKTRSNILKDFSTRIALFGDPVIQRNTSKNDFDIRNLRKEKMSIYIHIPEREKERLSPLLTLFWTQVIDNLTIIEPNLADEPYPVLALMDEFGSLSRIEKLKSGISFLRSFRIVPIIILQYLAQLESIYGKNDARGFLNAKIKIAFTLNDNLDAQYISECLGQTTIRAKARSVSSHTGSSGISINHSDQLRPLMRPEEIMRMPKNEALVLIEGQLPVRAKKCFWFKEKKYMELLSK